MLANIRREAVNFVNTHEAKTNLSRLLEKVSQGKEIIIANAGTPIARLVPYSSHKTRKPGIAKGKITSDFFEPLPEAELKAWNQ